MRLDQRKAREVEESLRKLQSEMDEEQFEELFRRYRPLVRKLWQRYFVPDLEFADWEQEARLVLLKVVKSYRGTTPGQFSGFLKQSLVNRILDFYRARQATKRIPAGLMASLTEDFSDSLRDKRRGQPDEISFCQQSFHELVCECSIFEREVLYAIHQGYSTSELAIELGCSKRKIQSALSRTRIKLLKIMEQ